MLGAKANASVRVNVSAREGVGEECGAKFNPSKMDGTVIGLTFCSGISLLGDG
jgi:hypothetical protein